MARSLAHGLGPSVDRATLTNGFQPLLAFLMVPVYWSTADPDLAVHAVVVLAAVADAASVFFIFRVAGRAWGSAAGFAAAARAAAALVIVFACGEATVQGVGWARMDADALDLSIEGPKGYREPARLLMPRLPPGAIVDAFQSGALAYYAPPSIQIVNLDGVVDRNAYGAIVGRRLRDYGHQRGVRWFADWPFNRDAWTFFSERASSPERAFREIWRGPLRGLPSRGPDQTILWAVEWPDGERGHKPISD